MVMGMAIFDVILRMELIYNVKAHILPHLSCTLIEGIEESCIDDCEYKSSSRLGPSLQTYYQWFRLREFGDNFVG